MIRALVVDDEAPARAHLIRLLSAHADVEVVAEAANGLDALERLAEQRPGVMFLDIEMPGLSGFDVLGELSAPPITVFATAFDEYAVRAFEANAIDYLLKPVQAARLAQTLDRVRATVAAAGAGYRASLQQTLAAVYRGVPARIVGRRGTRLILLSPKEILYASIEDQLVFLHTASDRFTTDRTMADLEALLASADFFRVSRAAVVNLNYARELVPWASGTWKVRLTNGVELDVSRDRARELKARLL
jgi:two-component system LytT family response regulator/two-component system response regulator LytT